jgi:hypothetical protein
MTELSFIEQRVQCRFCCITPYASKFTNILVNLENLVTSPGSGSRLEDSDPLTDRKLRLKDSES